MTMTNEQRDKAIEETHTAVIQILERWQIVDDLKKTVYGNGRDGLKTRVVRLEVARKYSSRWIALGSHAVVGIVVGLVVAFFGK